MKIVSSLQRQLSMAIFSHPIYREELPKLCSGLLHNLPAFCLNQQNYLSKNLKLHFPYQIEKYPPAGQFSCEQNFLKLSWSNFCFFP
jgi:hypothetical protein